MKKRCRGIKKDEEAKAKAPYDGTFLRYEKELNENYTVSMDILIGKVVDRQTGSVFSASWVLDNSSKRELKGKTITESLPLSIINQDALIVMKMICGRNIDIRDIFMIIPSANNITWIKQQINDYYNFNVSFKKVKEIITSPMFRDNLQGVFGSIDETTFGKHKKALLDLEK